MSLVFRTIEVHIDHLDTVQVFTFEVVEEEGAVSSLIRARDIVENGYVVPRQDGLVRFFPPHRIQEVRIVDSGKPEESPS